MIKDAVENNLSSDNIDALSEVSSSLRTTLSSKQEVLTGAVKRNTDAKEFIPKNFISSYKDISFVALQQV